METSAPKKLQKSLLNARSALEKFNALEDLAEYYYNKQDYEKCLQYFQQELDAAETLKNEFKIAKAHRMIGEVLCLLCKYKDALKHQKMYYEYACEKSGGRLAEQQRALTTLGRTYFLYGESYVNRNSLEARKLYNQAQDHLLRSLLVCEKLEKESIVNKSEISEMRAISLLNRGLVYESQKETEKAVEQLELALRVSRVHHLPSIQRKCCLSLATLLVRLDKTQDAFKLFKEAINSTKSLSDQERCHAKCEILEAEEEAHIKNGDVSSARKVLQKAYRMKSNFVEERATIAKRLKADVAMDHALRQLRTENLSPDEEMKLYERLGDGFSERRVHDHAFTYYEKMLQSCMRAGLDPKPCYVSLAQTARDLERFKDAISYFEEEIAVSTPEDACLTYLLIVECQEMIDVSAEERLNTVHRAWSIAQNTDTTKLKIKVLKELEKVQQEVGDPNLEETKETLQNLCKSLKDHPESSDSEESSAGTQNIGEHIDLDALSDYSHEESEQEFEVLENAFGPSTTGRPKRSRHRANATWKNEKGETKLHLACIRGNINSVQTLLEEGCDVNATDHAGWTPLHEACNHGHVEIVEMLLDRGANINHKASGGITPLHDAASAGNFDVMDILLRRNASVLILTDEGHNLLHALQEYREREGDGLAPEEDEQYKQMVEKIKTCLDKVGSVHKDKPKKQISNSSNKHVPTFGSRNVSRDVIPCAGNLRRGFDLDNFDGPQLQRSVMRDISLTSNSSTSSQHSASDNEDGREGVSEYQKAIKNVRKNTSVLEEIPREARKSIPALLPATEIVDNWLDDDLKSRPPKRRRTVDLKLPTNKYTPLPLKKKSNNRLSLNSRSSSRASSNGSRNSIGSFGSHEDISLGLSIGSRSKVSPEIVSPTPLMWDDNLDFPMANDEFAPDSPIRSIDDAVTNSYCSTPLTRSCQRQVTLPSFGIIKNTISPHEHTFQPFSQITSQTVPNLINIGIEDVLLAIPVVDPSYTVKWLMEEAAKRFYRRKGVQPKLEIQTAEGACLADDDPVSFLLGGNTLIGIIKDVAAITDRYKDACNFDGIEMNDSVLSSLEQSQATHNVTIIDLALPLPVLKPVFKAIAMERSLLRINFSNNCMDDEGLENLCEHFGRLINLKELDLSCNGISALGIQALVGTAEKGNLKNLIELNLSSNDLHDTCVVALSQLTAALPQLQSLAVADCHFSKHMWDQHTHLLTLSSLKCLDISGNLLEAMGVAGWLGYADHNKNRRLNANVLEVLRLVGVGGSRICQELVLFMDDSQDVALTELRISYDDMQDDDMTCLLRVLESAPKLRNLSVPVAPNLSGMSICKLLRRQLPLSNVEIKIKAVMEESVDTEEWVSAAIAARGIENLTLRGVPAIFEETWKNVKGVNGSVKKGALGVRKFQTVKE